MKKSQIRKITLKKRANSNFKHKKINFLSLLKLLNQETKDKKIGFYYPIGSEICTLELIENLRKKKYIISLPVLKKNFKMSFYEWPKKNPLKINNFGITEPIKQKKIVPNKFDKKMNYIFTENKVYR